MAGPDGHGRGQGHGRGVGTSTRHLGWALALILGFMAGEVVVGLLARSLALVSDAAHMLTDAAAIALALVAARIAARPARGNFTWGLRRVEILAAQVNGVLLVLLAAGFVYAAVRRLQHPAEVVGAAVLLTALVGIAVNLVAAWLVSRADRRSLNVEGAFWHLLTDLFAFVATAVAGAVVLVTGWARADAVATLVVAVLMVLAGWRLLRESWRVFLEAAPHDIDVAAIDADLHREPGVVDVHDLHVWEVTSGFPALSAHVLVALDRDCHEARLAIAGMLRDSYAIEHTTLQVDHASPTVIPAEDLLRPPGPTSV
jgi:cobalt-zinc-cadmium efflux system protein